MRKVVITGMGTISQAGGTVEELCHQLGTGCFNYKAKELKIDFNDENILKSYPRLDKACRLFLTVSEQALKDAVLYPECRYSSSRIGIIVGTTFGVLDSQEQYLHRYFQTGIGFPAYFQQTAQNLISGITAYKYNLKGLNFSVFNEWTSGLDALVLGKELIAAGQLDAVVAGGIDILSPSVDRYYEELRNTGKLKDIFTVGEGCGVLVLEAEDTCADKSRIKGFIMDCRQGSFDNEEEVEKELIYILGQNHGIDNYIAGLREVQAGIAKKPEISMCIKKLLDFSPVLDSFGAAAGVLKTIYAASLNNQKSIIFNTNNLGQYSYLTVKGGCMLGK